MEAINPMVHWGLVNSDAEMAVLAAMLRGSEHDAQTIAHNLDSGAFYGKGRRLVFAASVNVLNKDHVINRELVVAEALRLREIFKIEATREQIENEVINKLPDVPVNPLEQAKLVEKFAWCRNAATFTLEMQKRLQLNPDVHELYAWGQSEWQLLSPQIDNGGWVYAWDVVDQHAALLHADAIRYDEGAADAFGWPWWIWNQRVLPLEGGLVGVLIAPDGAGKSTIMDQIGEHWSRKKHIAMVHFEDSKRKKWNRRLTRFSGVEYSSVKRGVHMDETTDSSIRVKRGVFTDDELQQIVGAQRELRDSGIGQRLHYYHTPGASMRDVIRFLEAKVDEGVCEGVILDYLNKVQADARQSRLFGSDKNERQADDMEQLKTFAERMDIPVLTASQGNKEIMNATTMTREHLLGSGQVSHKAQLVIMMRREQLKKDVHSEETGDLIAEKGNDSPIVEFRVDKQNDGPKSEFKMWFAGERFKFVDLEDRT